MKERNEKSNMKEVYTKRKEKIVKFCTSSKWGGNFMEYINNCKGHEFSFKKF